MKKTLSLIAAGLVLVGCGASKNAAGSYDDVKYLSSDEKVNAGYVEVSKRHNTSSISRVVTNETDGAIYNSIYDYLEGKVSGVDVTPDGHIHIRGVNSINSSTEPLFIVDGMACEDPNIIIPSEIYTVDVLKDSSAAIYGARGANGVIIITTKSAAQEQIRLDAERARIKAEKRAAREAQKKAKQEAK